ncbi:MAG TPA: hypothetical protein VHM28_03280 [Anaerolineales bacterium]|jgi:hypothetical protein|nr:hypothetical protein [Anaerolineales bacterium]
MVNKEVLDNILALYKAQPVGNGYIDIIVKRENARQLIENLILNGIRINRITWWEYVDANAKSTNHGYGGPKSRYYGGWFSEIGFSDDEIDTNIVEEIMKVIRTKEIAFHGREKVNYEQEEWLTPALWLDVPDEWKSG